MKLNLLPLHLHNGQIQDQLPGLYIAAPPRKPARGRHAEQLLIYLVLEGALPLSSTQESQLLERLAQIYYQTSGSATTALRATAESLNEFLFERNLKNSSSGKQGIGYLGLVTLRGDHLYLAQSGPLHAYFLTRDGVQHSFDPETAGRGLGVGRVAPVRFAQTRLADGDLTLITAAPASTWNLASLATWRDQPLERITSRLRSAGPADLRALLLQAVPGEGVERLTPPKDSQVVERPAPAPPARRAESPVESSPAVEAPPVPRADLPPATPPVESSPPTPVVVEPEAVAELKPEAPPAPTTAAAARYISGQTAEVQPEKRSTRQASLGKLLSQRLRSAARSIGLFFSRLEDNTRSLAQKILPGEELFTIPPGVMLFFAVAVPLVVVTVASVVYFRRGRGGQYEALYMQAVQAANHARNQSEPRAGREAWQSVIGYLAQSAEYQVTDASRALEDEAQASLDGLNLINRPDFQPAISGNLPANMQITRLISVDDSLYLLDTTASNVLRALKTARGYELDETFRCGIDYLAEQASPLIDMALGSKESGAHAPLYVLDNSGGILYCLPGEFPEKRAVAPPVEGWAQPNALTTSLGHTFVLDPGKNAVWLYRNSNFGSQPLLIFDIEIPPMQDVIDLAIDRDDLYLLHQDGHITICSFSLLGASPTHCNDPVLYTDTRPGYESQPLLPEEAFTQIQATEPPDPSLYLLQPQSRAVFHFSLRLLTYHRQIQPVDDIPLTSQQKPPVTAFTVDSDARLIFLAFGNQVFYAAVP